MPKAGALSFTSIAAGYSRVEKGVDRVHYVVCAESVEDLATLLRTDKVELYTVFVLPLSDKGAVAASFLTLPQLVT